MWFILGTCLEVIGWGTIIDAYGVPYVCQGVPNCGTNSMFGEASQLPSDPNLCYLKVYPQDPYYDFLWNQPVTVDGVLVHTPDVSAMTAQADAPYAYRKAWADEACPQWLQQWGWCTPENVCTPADVDAGSCTP